MIINCNVKAHNLALLCFRSLYFCLCVVRYCFKYFSSSDINRFGALCKRLNVLHEGHRHVQKRLLYSLRINCFEVFSVSLMFGQQFCSTRCVINVFKNGIIQYWLVKYISARFRKLSFYFLYLPFFNTKSKQVVVRFSDNAYSVNLCFSFLLICLIIIKLFCCSNHQIL